MCKGVFYLLSIFLLRDVNVNLWSIVYSQESVVSDQLERSGVSTCTQSRSECDGSLVGL